MKANPDFAVDLDWLERRWRLPAAARPIVESLLAAETAGSTAWRCPDGIAPDWGAALGLPEAPGCSPLLWIEGGGEAFLQSRRVWAAESFLAREFFERARRSLPSPETIEQSLVRLFPGCAPDHRQVAAVRLAASRELALITGGPGTGKTFTLARLILLLLEEGLAGADIHLAAPTGKAADRMKQSILAGLPALENLTGASLAGLAQAAEASGTLHRLLGQAQRHGGLLPGELLIVDECSMVDLGLWEAVLRATEGKRLILLGDPRQLESVGQGNVLSALVDEVERGDSPLRECHVHLTETHRFRDRPALLEMARALEDSDAGRVVNLLQEESNDGGLAWLDPGAGFPRMENFPEAVREAWSRLAGADSPEAALAETARVCVLTARREGASGASGINAAIGAWLARGGPLKYQPILILRNDAETGLRNGSVGVRRDGQAWFAGRGGALEEFALGQLPDFGPAWAMTIHRAQGSEYDEVVVVLPREESPLASRELLYTAVTRARRHATLVGSAGAIEAAATAGSQRLCLLSVAWDRLRQRGK